MLSDVRRAAWWLIPGFLLADLGLRVWSTSWTWQDRLAGWAWEPSGGLANWNLFGRIDDYLLLAVLVVLIGRLRPSDLGWKAENLVAGLLTLVGVWAALQLVVALVALASGEGLAWHDDWLDEPNLVVIGWLVGHLFGTAAVEETAYRGFLLPQLTLWLGQRRWRLGIALVGSQLLFALSHIPQWVEFGMETPFTPAIVFLLGLVFAGIYLATENLFIAMAFHALHDAPTPLLASPVDPHLIMLILEVIFLAVVLARSARTAQRPGGLRWSEPSPTPPSPSPIGSEPHSGTAAVPDQ
jgi:membrane protease YdiL (CAAX protease family)